MRNLFWALIVLGVVARVVMIAVSYGSNDIHYWAQFALWIRQTGIFDLYQNIAEPPFNHPPLMGWMAAALQSIAYWTGTPFHFWFKLPSLAADVLVLALLYRSFGEHGSRIALVSMTVFAWNPVSILVTGYHGNTDSICAAFGLLAAHLHQQRRYDLAGFAVAAAINVKLIGLMWLPGLLLLCPDREQAKRFTVATAMGGVPFLLPLAIVPGAFVRNAIAYNSYTEMWGISVFLIESRPWLGALGPVLVDGFASAGRYLILGLVGLAAVMGRLGGFDAYRSCALGIAGFMLLTPGFGVQYLVWIVPVLAATSLRFSLTYAVLGGTFALVWYSVFLLEGLPLRSFHQGMMPARAWVPGLAVWITLVAFAIGCVRLYRARSRS